MDIDEERTQRDARLGEPVICRIVLVGRPAEFEKLQNGLAINLAGNRLQEELFAAINRAAQPT
jgi:hypothetical protein